MIGMKRSSLILSEYNPDWRNGFLSERDRILSACLCKVAIEHIGSTSIPGIIAKPILDIALLIETDDLKVVAACLSALGYDYRGSYGDISGHFYAALDRSDTRICQIHLYTDPNAGWNQQILFRDILRRNDDLRDEYAAAKLEVQKKAGLDKGLYAIIKSDWVDTFFQKINERAQKGA